MIGDLPIPVEALTQGGAGVIVVLIIVMILTARLVPRSYYLELQKERDFWRDAAHKNAEHTSTLLPSAHIAAQVMTALAGATGVHSPNGAPAHVVLPEAEEAT